MVWYQHLNRSTPYLKNFRRWNMWYDYNNAKHHEMKRMKSIFLEHMLRRMCKHEAYQRFFLMFCGIPLVLFFLKSKKRFAKKPEEEPGK